MTSKLVTRDGTVVNNARTIPSLNEALDGIIRVTKSDKLLLVALDASGSMLDTLDDKSKMEVAWNVLKTKLIPNLNGWDYGVIVFQDVAHWAIRPHSLRKFGELIMPQADGTTAMLDALSLCWKWIQQNAEHARIILLTDGMANDASPNEIIEKVVKHIPIDTVGIGHKESFMYDPTFLKKLSQLTGGIFSEAHDAHTLIDIINKLSPINRPLLGTVPNSG